MGRRFLDTCSLLELANLSDIKAADICLSSVTLQELENIKTSANKDSEIKYRARVAVRALKDNPGVEIIVVDRDDYQCLEEKGLEPTNDNLIIASAYRHSQEHDIIFYTEDLLCGFIAKNYFWLEVQSVKTDDKSDMYKGYKVVVPTDEELAQVYDKDNCDNLFGCNINEYVVINDSEGNFCDVLRWTGTKYANVFNKVIKTLAFGDKIKAKDIYQRMVMDSILNNTMTCISGKAGSGKSLLSLVCAMYLIENGKYDSLVILFNPCPVRGATQMGYYQGSLIDKAMQSNIGNVLITKFGDRFAVDNYIAQGKIKLIPMTECRGMEIRDNEILYITEAENTTVDLMKICLSRVSSGAKVIVEGDFEQVDSKLFDINNGMARVIEILTGEDVFGYVQLQNIWRSKIATLVDKL